MRVNGIIAEYNPFHNGHLYQINTLREQTRADYVIIAMSGDFLQRGVPAVADKYTRAKLALLSGADLVLELPVLWSTASAEHFAQGGVLLLSASGVVTHLGFGVETDDSASLLKLAEILAAEPDSYSHALQQYLKVGNSYPSARACALSDYLSVNTMNLSDNFINKKDLLLMLLSLPNNILALEYEKTLLKLDLQNHIIPVPILRKGDGYHESEAHSHFASAAAVRKRLLSSDNDDPQKDTLAGLIPPDAFLALAEYQNLYPLLSEDSVSQILGYRLHLLEQEGYTDFSDCNAPLSAKMKKHLPGYRSFTQFCECLKSKELTHTRISRVLMHILLDIRNTDTETAFAQTSAPYLRILGFRESALPLLTAIKKNASAPIITKPADAFRQLSENSYAIFQKDLLASDIYRQLMLQHAKQLPPNDFCQKLVIVP